MTKYRVSYKITKHGIISYKDIIASSELEAREMCITSIGWELQNNTKCECISYRDIVNVVSVEKLDNKEKFKL
jgi:hypothetical protein